MDQAQDPAARNGSGGKSKSPHPLRDMIEVIVFAVVMALGLKVFALEAYQIPTGSMQPNLMGTSLLSEDHSRSQGGIHDRVLVDKLCYLLRDPQRWEVVVFRYPLVVPNNYVKRLVGMPGEELTVQFGDLYARPLGSNEDFHVLRKPPGVQDTLWRLVWPEPGADPAAWKGWDLNREVTRGPDGVLTLRANGTAATSGNVVDQYNHGYPAAIYNRIPAAGAASTGRNPVSDLRVTGSATPQAGAGALRVELEAGTSAEFHLILDPRAGQVRLEGPGGFARQQDLAFQDGAEVRFELAYWDHQLRCSVHAGGTFDYFGPLDLPPTPVARNRVRLNVEAGAWSVPPPRVERDIFYLPPLNGTGMGQETFEVPAGHYFMMGDNTQNSLDSRDWEARVITTQEPIRGATVFRGDQLENGSDPFYDNPRWNQQGTVMTFRDQWGEQFCIPREDIATDLREPAPLVPREYILGKALAVFLPIPPLAPVFRVKTVR